MVMPHYLTSNVLVFSDISLSALSATSGESNGKLVSSGYFDGDDDVKLTVFGHVS
jgi:hypothetical protein